MTKYPIIEEEIIQGRDWLAYLVLQYPDGTARTDIAGASIYCDLRKSPTSPIIIASPLGAVTSSVLGEISLSLTGMQTLEIEAESIVGTVSILLRNGETEYPAQLNINVKRTRPAA